jgi:hypothetical protein
MMMTPVERLNLSREQLNLFQEQLSLNNHNSLFKWLHRSRYLEHHVHYHVFLKRYLLLLNHSSPNSPCPEHSNGSSHSNHYNGQSSHNNHNSLFRGPYSHSSRNSPFKGLQTHVYLLLRLRYNANNR